MSANQPVRRLQQRLTIMPVRTKPQVGGGAQEHITLALPGYHQRNYAAYVSFVICVILPIFIATVYYGWLASNQYVAEFRFTVRDTSSPNMMGGANAGLSGMFGAASMTGKMPGSDDYLVVDYLTSRQAVEELQERIQVIGLYSQPDIDWWSRFGKQASMEKFVDYWKKMVTARYDMMTGLSTAQIRAFSAEDALLIANTMVTLSEQLINGIERRSQADAVRFAAEEVEKAEARLKQARGKLTAYRAKMGIIDPTTSVTASNSLLVQQQRQNIAQLEMQLNNLQSQNLSTDAPAVVALRAQVASAKEQLRRVEADVAKGLNGSALSQVVGTFEQLQLDVEFAQKMVTSTMTQLETARANSLQQHLYITPYVRPSLPRSSTYPNRFRSVLTVAALAFGFWITLLIVSRSIRERFG
jgi:capsular polysaccharide transport system permease protein